MKKEFDFINTFPPLGHPEHHFNKYPNHPWLKTKEEIIKWIDENVRGSNLTFDGIENCDLNGLYEVCEDLTVNMSLDVDYIMINKKNSFMPVQIRCVESFYMNDCNLETLVGTPYFLKELSVMNNKLTNFIGMPLNVKSEFIIKKNDIKSWDGFTSCNLLWWWSEKELNVNGNEYKLLMEAPKNIKRIYLNTNEYIGELVFDGTVDVNELRNLQMLHQTNENKDKINNQISLTNSKINKRKI